MARQERIDGRRRYPSDRGRVRCHRRRVLRGDPPHARNVLVDPMTASRTRRIAVPLLKLLVSTGLIAILLSRIDAARLWDVARKASLGWLALALCVYLVMILVSAWRWGLLLDAQGIPIRFGRLTSSFLVATFFNNFLPSNIGGDVIR